MMAFVYSAAQSMARRWVRAESLIIMYGGGSRGFRRSRIPAIKRKGEREIENTRRDGFPVAQLQTAVFVTDDKDFASEERLRDLYKRWRSHHGISRDLEEDLKHFNIFKENAKYVHSYNKKGGQHRLNLNKFADMTDEEFMSYHCLGSRHHRMCQRSLCGTGNVLNEKMTGLPPSVDWREKDAVTEVKDQGEYCGEFSCRGVIDGHENVPANDEDALLKAAANLPVSVAIDAMGSDVQFYSEGVFTRHCGTNLDHGVAIVGNGGLYPIKSSPNPAKEGVPPTKDEL